MKTKQTLYFIALIPPEPIFSEVESFKQNLFEKYQTKVALKSPAHITVYPPFKWDFSQEMLLKNTLQNFAKMHKAFEISLAGFGSFPPRVLFVQPQENSILKNIRSHLFQYLKEEMQLEEKRYLNQPFNPHMTIANRDLSKEDFYEAWEELKDKAYEKSFQADKISLLKHNGHHWEILQNYLFSSQT